MIRNPGNAPDLVNKIACMSASELTGAVMGPGSGISEGMVFCLCAIEAWEDESTMDRVTGEPRGAPLRGRRAGPKVKIAYRGLVVTTCGEVEREDSASWNFFTVRKSGAGRGQCCTRMQQQLPQSIDCQPLRGVAQW